MCLARHGARVGHGCGGFCNVSKVIGRTEARTQRAYRVNVTERHAIRHLSVSDFVHDPKI